MRTNQDSCNRYTRELAVVLCANLCSFAQICAAQDVLTSTDLQYIGSSEILALNPVGYLHEYADEGMIDQDLVEIIGDIRPTDDRKEALRICDYVNKVESLPYMIRRWVTLVPIFWGHELGFIERLERAEAWMEQSKEDYGVNLLLRVYFANKITQSGPPLMSGPEQLATVDRLMTPIVDDEQHYRLATVYAIARYAELRGQCILKADDVWRQSDQYRSLSQEERRNERRRWKADARQREIELLRIAMKVLETVKEDPERAPGFLYHPPPVQANVLDSAARYLSDLMDERTRKIQ